MPQPQGGIFNNDRHSRPVSLNDAQKNIYISFEILDQKALEVFSDVHLLLLYIYNLQRPNL